MLSIIVVGAGAIYIARPISPQVKSGTSTQVTSSVVSSASSSDLLRIEEAQLVIDKGSPGCPPFPCGLHFAPEFTIFARNLANQDISSLQVHLGNLTVVGTGSTIHPGQVYVGSATAPAYPVCSFQPLTISGTLANQTSFAMRGKVLATGTQGEKCAGPLLVSLNQVAVPVNATNLSSIPGNATWSVVAKNNWTQADSEAYATLSSTNDLGANGSGYKSLTLDLGAMPPGGNVSRSISFPFDSACCQVVDFHLRFLNGTSLDSTVFVQKVNQGYFRSFVMSGPGNGVLSAYFLYPNSTSLVNLTSLLTVESLSGSPTSQGISLTANPSEISSKPGYKTLVSIQIGITTAASAGVYLISYPFEVCPGIILVVGAQPSTIPPLPLMGGFLQGSHPPCLDSQLVASNEQVQVISGLSLAYLPEKITGP
jgi:hypothetical protein